MKHEEHLKGSSRPTPPLQRGRPKSMMNATMVVCVVFNNGKGAGKGHAAAAAAEA